MLHTCICCHHHWTETAQEASPRGRDQLGSLWKAACGRRQSDLLVVSTEDLSNSMASSHHSLPQSKTPATLRYFIISKDRKAFSKSKCGKISRNLKTIKAGILGLGWEASWYQVVLSTSPNGLLFPQALGTQKGNEGSGCVCGSLPRYFSQSPLLRQRAPL